MTREAQSCVGEASQEQPRRFFLKQDGPLKKEERPPKRPSPKNPKQINEFEPATSTVQHRARVFPHSAADACIPSRVGNPAFHPPLISCNSDVAWVPPQTDGQPHCFSADACCDTRDYSTESK